MKHFFIAILFTVFSACTEPQAPLINWKYYFKNELEIPIYLKKMDSGLVSQIDTIPLKSMIGGESMSIERPVPDNLKGFDSIRVEFGEEKYLTFSSYNQPRSIYNIDIYIESPKYTLTYTFTQEDYDNALPM